MAVTVDRTHDVPYLAGTSTDGQTVYIDRHLPVTIKVDGKDYDPTAALVAHETTEFAAMTTGGKSYHDAHTQDALPAERKVVEADGVNWKSYNAALAPFIAADEAETHPAAPRDLYLKPYCKDKQELARLAASGVFTNDGPTISGTWDCEFSISAVAAADAPPVTPAVPASATPNIGSQADRGPGARAEPPPTTNPNPSAKLDLPDSQQSVASKQIGGNAPGKPPLPKFALSAYNGGPMKLGGWKFPVVIDAAGVQFATPKMPIYAGGHPPEDATPAELMDCLVGQADCSAINGCIKAAGVVTGDGDTVQRMLGHSAKGFRFQASVHGRPTTNGAEWVGAGESRVVNGRAVVGPCVIARSSLLDHIAILPLGADTTTSAQIAADGRRKDSTMNEFALWLKATYALDPAALNDEQTVKFKAEFDKVRATAPAPKPALVIAAGHDGGDEIQVRIKAQREAVAAEDQRIAAVRKLAGEYPEISAEAIKDGWTVERTENAVMKAERADLTKRTFGAGGDGGEFAIHDGNRQVKPEEMGVYRSLSAAFGGRAESDQGANTLRDMQCRIVEAGALISAGQCADGKTSWAERVAKSPQYGERIASYAEQLMQQQGYNHAMGPVALFDMAASFAGVRLPRNHRSSEYLRVLKAEFSTIQLDVITSNLNNKFLQDGYTAVDPDHADPTEGTVAWKKFARPVPLNDFKPHYFDRLVGDFSMQPLTDTGEIQHGKLGEQSYTVTGDTFAILLEISRKTIINDDQSALSTTPTGFGRGAGIRHCLGIYGAVLAGLQSDGATAFWTATAITKAINAKNQMAANLLASSPLNFTNLGLARAQFMVQTDPMGLPFGGVPQILLVPPGLLDIATALYTSSQLGPLLVTTGGSQSRGTPTDNTLKGRYRPVCSAWLVNHPQAAALDSASAGAWYLSTSPTSNSSFVLAGFLNGQEMPVVERGEPEFNRLGISFRGFTDFGASLGEPRSTVRNTA